jgi:hypothetical protein
MSNGLISTARVVDDRYDFADTKTVTGVNQSTGAGFGQPTASTSGSVVRLSTRYTF